MKWFISDLHVDHEKVLTGTRRQHFPTIKDWQEGVFEGINKTIYKHDFLFLLGDFAHSNLSKWRQRIKRGNIWLIKGNHDPSDKVCREVFGSNFRHVFETKLNKKQSCWLSHYAHAFWPKSHHGSYHLYGHCHGQREETLNHWMPERRSMEVCPETIFSILGEWRPINEFEILDYLKTRKGHDPIDFYVKLRGTFNAD